MPTRPHQFRHRDVVRAVRAAAVAGISNPKTVEIRLPNGTTIAVGGSDNKPDVVAVVKPTKTTRRGR